MLFPRGLPLFLVLVLIASLALEAEGGRRRRLKRQHRSHDHEDDLRRARRREQRRARWRAVAEEGGSASVNASAIPATPIRHRAPGSEGIRVGEAVDSPTCPPPATPFVPELCSAPACLHHQQCQQEQGDGQGKGGDLACCFNGCVHTCLPPVGSPPVIDWLEDTDSLLPILGKLLCLLIQYLLVLLMM
ncbi:uncharacterized protein LOC122253493 [Penaeus japonicus]|uniref:uncharacterized protein LOC122253493 n=1 Tax=Penaeus japonicus TaxID=27405 RepID=UPI001C70BA93|nr:uncharacterized protein LOC122253493 [Penaeus japonicus]